MKVAGILKRLWLAAGRMLNGEVWYARRIGLTIGRDCQLYRIIYGSEPWLIKIGDHVQITQGVRLLTHGGGWLAREISPQFDSFGPVVIGSHVYIGNAAIILPGVSIGNRVLIAAGAVVTRSVPDNCVVGGNPARVISTLDAYLAGNTRYDMGTAGLNPDEKRRVIEANPERLIRRDFLTP